MYYLLGYLVSERNLNLDSISFCFLVVFVIIKYEFAWISMNLYIFLLNTCDLLRDLKESHFWCHSTINPCANLWATSWRSIMKSADQLRVYSRRVQRNDTSINLCPSWRKRRRPRDTTSIDTTDVAWTVSRCFWILSPLLQLPVGCTRAHCCADVPRARKTEKSG